MGRHFETGLSVSSRNIGIGAVFPADSDLGLDPTLSAIRI
jgi:hypothetical protein